MLVLKIAVLTNTRSTHCGVQIDSTQQDDTLTFKYVDINTSLNNTYVKVSQKYFLICTPYPVKGVQEQKRLRESAYAWSAGRGDRSRDRHVTASDGHRKIDALVDLGETCRAVLVHKTFFLFDNL